MMKGQQLKALLKLLRSQGVVSYKCDGLEVVIDPNFKETVPEAPKHVPGQLASELNRASPGFVGMSDEEVLMWSSEGAN
jgi:hypothetical protein